MADQTTSKAKNEAFLKHMEQQRLNKPCNRVIDLRGKVAGECQAYSFGGKTHYLDDRGYLLAKQLLDHFDGRYTFGVYESLLTALKSLDSSPVESTTIAVAPILNRDKTHIQHIPFDYQLHRKEPRINFATPVEIHIADVLYHAATIDITTSAIRIALKRAFTLEQGDIVAVSLPDLSATTPDDILKKIPFKVMKISHDELRTYIILTRNRKDDLAISRWFDQWSLEHNTPEYLDLDNELFNIARHFYLRLYCQSLSKPLFWLASDDEAAPIKACHMTTMAADALQFLRDKTGDLDLSVLPIKHILNQNVDHLVLLSQHKNKIIPYIAKRDDSEAVASLLHWHAQQQNSHLLLVHIADIQSSPQDFEPEITAIAEFDAEGAKDFEQRLTALTSLITITNITESCQHLNQAKQAKEPPKIKSKETFNTIKPTRLQHHTERDNQRFFIRTDVNLFFNKQTFNVITNDVSETGVSLSLPGDVPIEIGTRVKLEFIRWQKLTKKVRLESIPFIVRNKHVWSGETHLGLQRDSRACAYSINQFFESAIELNKDQLVENNDNVHVSHESKVFASLLTEQIITIPIYLGTDKHNKRILQAIATTGNNFAQDKHELWLAIQEIITPVYELVKTIVDKPESAISFGLYCYQDNNGIWQISIENSFANAAEKTLFINRALLCEHHYFFHCSLSAFDLNAINNELDLYQQLSELRIHSQHKVKQIREVLHSLFAAGELTDITALITAAYTNI